jgi:hypothetical protein
VEALAAEMTRVYLSELVLHTLNPKEFKESLARLVLRSVFVEEGRVVVEVGI